MKLSIASHLRLLFALLLGSLQLLGQAGSATVSGTVHDASGAIVPNATVTATNTATGIAHNTVTTGDGLYVLPNLPPGNYVINVTAPGFQPKQVTGIGLDVDQKATINVDLAVGTSTESVTVSGAALMLQTEDASVGTAIQTKQIQDLPLNGRMFTQLLELVPGTTPSTRTAGFTNADPNLAGKERNGMPSFDVNGRSGAYTYYRIDGIENTEREFGGANIPISVDAIQEFKLQTADFSAEYGRGPAQVNVVTKTGTNRFHGTLFEFIRNDDFNASQWALTGPHSVPLLKRNQFGGNFGGPIRKDKLFFFFNYDGTREVYSSPRTVTVPTNDMRNGIFPAGEVIYNPITGQPFANNTIPASMINPITAKVLSVLPSPNIPGVPVTNSAGLPLPTTNNFYYNPTHRQTIDQSSARIDYTISPKDTVSGRYTYSPNTLIGQGPLATNIQGSIVGYEVAHLGGSNLSTSWVHTFNPTTINEFSFGFMTDPQDYEKGDTTNYAAQFGLSQFLPSNGYPGLPHFQIGSVNLGSGDYRPLTVGEHNYQWTDNLTMIRGAHSIRIGADIRQTGLTTQNSEVSTGRFYFNGAETRNPATNSTATGDAMADFLLGDMSQFGVGTPIQPVHKTFSTWAGYINDTWHVRQNLTLTLGFRYELTTRWHADPAQYAMPIIRNGEFADIIAVADPGGKLSSRVLPQALAATPGVIVGCTTVGLPSNCLVTDWKDWQPRLGIAYQLTSKTVVRAGGGIFYDYFYGDLDTEDGERYPFEIFNQTQTYTKVPTNGVPPLSISNPPVGGIGTPVLFASVPNRRVPGSYQWNFTVEQQLAKNTNLSVAYVASLGRHLESTNEYWGYYNIPQPWGVVLAPGQTQHQVDPRFSDIIMWMDQDTSDYQSLQTKLERRLSGGLSFIASYTFAKNLGIINGLGDPRFPQLDKESLNDDVRHNLVVSPIWQIPVGRGRQFMNTGGWRNVILGGWQATGIVSYHTGFPFTPTLSGTDLLNLHGYHGPDRPDAVCSGSLSNPTPGNWFNKNCFVLPVEPTSPGALLREGNLGANTLRGPNFFNADFGLSKTFAFTERVNLDFRAEAFNVFNHPSLGLPTAAIVPGNNTPAQITSTFSLPRELQFAMKLRF